MTSSCRLVECSLIENIEASKKDILFVEQLQEGKTSVVNKCELKDGKVII